MLHEVILLGQIEDIPGLPSVTQLLGLGIMAPAMIYSVRIMIQAKDKATAEAWESNQRLATEHDRAIARKDAEIDHQNGLIDRLRADNDRLRDRLRTRDTTN